MKRLIATIGRDVRLQACNGLYYATGFVLLVFVAVLSKLPLGELDLGWLMPAVVLNNLVIITFYFISGLILLEKAEGTLTALVTTPLPIWEYLAAKVATLTLVAILYNVVLIGIIDGLRVAVVPLIVGVALGSAIYILSGCIAVAGYDSINAYLLPSTLYTAALLAPVLASASGWNHWLLYLHPMHAPLVLLQAAFGAATVWQMVYGIVYGGVWVSALYWLGHHRFQHFVIDQPTGA